MHFRVQSFSAEAFVRGATLFAGFVVFALVAPGAFAQHYSDPDTLAPSFPSPQPVVDRMLALADVKPGEEVYDLGCGDGRIVITAATRYSAHGVGIEIRRDIYETTLAKVEALRLTKQVQIIHGDALKTDLTPADVVTLYLLTASNERLRPVLEKQLKPGARVISHDFEIRGWQPEQTEKVMFQGRPHMIYAYRMGSNTSPRHK